MAISQNNSTDNCALAEDGQTQSPAADQATRNASSPGRRDVLSCGAKLAFVVPVVMTFSANDALAAGSNHSCYAAGHTCPGNEPCCDGLSCNNGTCGDPCVPQGGLCFLDSDCCSGDCQLGECQ